MRADAGNEKWRDQSISQRVLKNGGKDSLPLLPPTAPSRAPLECARLLPPPQASASVVKVEVVERREVAPEDAARLLKAFMKEHSEHREGLASTNVEDSASQPVRVSSWDPCTMICINA
jgi:hypothetical protein